MYKVMNVVGAVSFGLALGMSQTLAEIPTVLSNDKVNQTSFKLDYVNAIPMEKTIELTGLSSSSSTQGSRSTTGKPGVSPGGQGTGEQLNESLGKFDNSQKIMSNDIRSDEYGTANIPFATSRVDMYNQRLSRKYPNRVAGKLFFSDGASTYVCSAASIMPGVVVTAAHCLYDNSADRYYSNFEFIPAYYADSTVGVKAPYGRYGVLNVMVLQQYVDPVNEVVNDWDVGVMIMKRRPNPSTGTNMFPGERTGYYAYSWDGYGYTNDLNEGSIAQIHQLGYPASHDNGWQMQKNNSQTQVYVADFTDVDASPTIIGSRMTGGSSGGPWLVNYGEVASLSGTTVGTEALNNVVVATTSWGYISTDIKAQGASPFTSDNIVPLMDWACTNYPANCGGM